MVAVTLLLSTVLSLALIYGLSLVLDFAPFTDSLLLILVLLVALNLTAKVIGRVLELVYESQDVDTETGDGGQNWVSEVYVPVARADDGDTLVIETSEGTQQCTAESVIETATGYRADVCDEESGLQDQQLVVNHEEQSGALVTPNGSETVTSITNLLSAE